ncbi:MAG: DEAD/DEAH box helicase [Steroidobacteraceae bacterium]
MEALLEGSLWLTEPGHLRPWLRDIATFRRRGRLPTVLVHGEARPVNRNVRFYVDGIDMEPPRDAIRIPRGLLHEVAQQTPLDVYDARSEGEPFDWPWNPPNPLYPEQVHYSQPLFRAGGGLLIAPPGTGKTNIGLALIAAWGRAPALWIAHTIELVRQAHDRARSLFPDLPREAFGILAEHNPWWGEVLTFATVQTLRANRWPEQEARLAVVVADEVHHAGGLSYARVLSRLPAKHRIGLTATHERPDGLEALVDALFGQPIVEVPWELLLRLGRVVLPHIVVVPTAFSAPPGLGWNRLQALRAGSLRRNALIIGIAMRERALGRRVVILTERIDHVHYLTHVLQGIYGIPARGLDGSVASAVRSRAVGSLERDRAVLVATKLLDEGVDVPLADCLILAATSRSRPLQWQRIGRVVRAAVGKQDAIVYDLADMGVPILAEQAEERLLLYQQLRFPVRAERVA